MSFAERIEKSNELTHRFIKYCKLKNLEYAFSGYENLIQSSAFGNKIKTLNDTTSMNLRYFPDIVLLNKKAWLIELKNSKYIEKAAYDNYMNLDNIGYNVGLIYYIHGEMRFVEISKLRFCQIINSDCPIIDNIWLSPRLMSDDLYFAWKSKHKSASGTSFGIIDTDKKIYTVLR